MDIEHVFDDPAPIIEWFESVGYREVASAVEWPNDLRPGCPLSAYATASLGKYVSVGLGSYTAGYLPLPLWANEFTSKVDMENTIPSHVWEVISGNRCAMIAREVVENAS